jgi:hypothetical protein
MNTKLYIGNMKIKLQDYSLISNEWIDTEIEELKKEKQKYLSDWYYIGQIEAKIDSLELVRQQLIPSEKLALQAWKAGFDDDKHLESTASLVSAINSFLISEIELTIT